MNKSSTTPENARAEGAPTRSRGQGTRRRHQPEAVRIGDRRRETLLDSAEQLLADTPASELTIESIASAASLSRSSVYFYFESKSAIVDALIVRASEEMLDNTHPRDANEALVAFVERIVMAALDGWRRHRAVFLAAAEFASHANEGTARWRAIMMVFVDRLADAMMRDVAEQGSSEDHAQARAQAEIICWMLERNYYMLFAREHTSSDEDDLAARLLAAAEAVLAPAT